MKKPPDLTPLPPFSRIRLEWTNADNHRDCIDISGAFSITSAKELRDGLLAIGRTDVQLTQQVASAVEI